MTKHHMTTTELEEYWSYQQLLSYHLILPKHIYHPELMDNTPALKLMRDIELLGLGELSDSSRAGRPTILRKRKLDTLDQEKNRICF